ncbi:MAG: thiol:disulfide interchange protein DsbA/DsbL [Burkholderiaceae bacterium]|nr:thiol:disulfide interchange protein DsbA/DsbL [Burkholderiaceae bacterium]
MRLGKIAVLVLGLMLSLGAVASPDDPQEGHEYLKVVHEPAMQGGKVEVTEFFLYGCPHCNGFEPFISGWAKARSSKVVLNRVPVMLHEGDEPWQKMYYALEALGQADALHARIFHAIHVEHRHLNDEEAIADFVAGEGVNRDAFVQAYRSFQVQSKLKQAQLLMQAYQIKRVPTLIVGGMYQTSLYQAGESLVDKPEPEYYAAALQVMSKLVTLSSQ